MAPMGPLAIATAATTAPTIAASAAAAVSTPASAAGSTTRPTVTIALSTFPVLAPASTSTAALLMRPVLLITAPAATSTSPLCFVAIFSSACTHITTPIPTLAARSAADGVRTIHGDELRRTIASARVGFPALSAGYMRDNQDFLLVYRIKARN